MRKRLDTNKLRNSHVRSHAATRTFCSADFHLQALQAPTLHVEKWRSRVSVLGKQTYSNFEYRTTLHLMFLGRGCMPCGTSLSPLWSFYLRYFMFLPGNPPVAPSINLHSLTQCTPDSTTHFIHNCPVKDVPPCIDHTIERATRETAIGLFSTRRVVIFGSSDFCTSAS